MPNTHFSRIDNHDRKAQTNAEIVRALPSLPVYRAAEIKNFRHKFSLSQANLATVLNVSLATVQKWEQGAVSPHGSVERLLYVIEKHGLGILN